MADAELVATVRSLVGPRLTAAEAQQIIGATWPLRASAGQVILREGEQADGLLLFLRGTAEILKGPEGGQRIARVEAPSLLGEMSLVTDLRHSATARALTDCECRVLTKPEFLRLLDAGHLAAYKLVATIAEVLARRLYLMDEKIVELAARRDHPAPVEELAAFKDKLFSEWSF